MNSEFKLVLAALVLWGGGGCSSVAPIGVEESTQPVILGDDTSDSDIVDSGIVAVYLTDGRLCSGVVLEPDWVLTAKHCTQEGVVWVKQFLHEGDTRLGRIESVREYPNEDAALIRYTDVSSPGIIARTVRYLPTPQSFLAGASVQCFGHGQTTFANTDLGIPAKNAILTVSTVGPEIYYLERNERGQILYFGDSGGPCYVRYSPNGERFLTGIQSQSLSSGGQITSARQVNIEGIVNWIGGLGGSAD